MWRWRNVTSNDVTWRCDELWRKVTHCAKLKIKNCDVITRHRSSGDAKITKETQEKIIGASDVILKTDDDDEARKPPNVITRGQVNDNKWISISNVSFFNQKVTKQMINCKNYRIWKQWSMWCTQKSRLQSSIFSKKFSFIFNYWNFNIFFKFYK